MKKGNGTLMTLYPILEQLLVYGLQDIEDFCPFFVKDKISKDIRSSFSCQTCDDQFYVFIICKLCVFCSTVCTIHDDNNPFFLFIHFFKMLLEKPTVTMVVLLIPVLCYNRAIYSNGFSKIGSISSTLFSYFIQRACGNDSWFCHSKTVLETRCIQCALTRDFSNASFSLSLVNDLVW